MDNALLFVGVALIPALLYIGLWLKADKLDGQITPIYPPAPPPPMPAPDTPLWHSRGRWHYRFVRGAGYNVSGKGQVKELALNQVITLNFGGIVNVLPAGSYLLEIETVSSKGE